MTEEVGASASAIAFPGQGGDWGAAVATLEARADHPLVAALADRLGGAGWDRLDGLDTRNAQPAIFVAGLVGPVAESLAGRTDVAIGHSLGEITAAAHAGALSPEAGLDLVVARATLGHACHVDRPGAMAVVLRWDAGQVEALRRAVLDEARADASDGPPPVLEVAVTNSATQVVLSGDADLVDNAVARANDAGGVARRLPIGGGYHSPLMAPAVEGLRAAARAAVRADPRVPVVSSTAGRAVHTAEDLVEVLARGLVVPVNWPAAVDVAVALGATAASEAGPGDTLGRLSRFLPHLRITES